MADSIPETRLDRIERRQRLLLAALVVPNAAVVAELIGDWQTVALGVLLGVVAFAWVAVSRRQQRDSSAES
jgi:hypothetical protein